jgi:hypothetical protein
LTCIPQSALAALTLPAQFVRENHEAWSGVRETAQMEQKAQCGSVTFLKRRVKLRVHLRKRQW